MTATESGEFIETGTTQNDEAAAEPDGGGVEFQNIVRPPPEPDDPTWTEREYIYSPDYVDEFVCQIDRDGVVLYMLQDGNYNVTALLDDTGAVLAQYAYEPYGETVVSEDFAPHAVNRVGHQGLFFERFGGSSNESVLAADALGLYYNRNRMYSPELGRFLQRDPNATGMPIITALASNAEAIDVLRGEFDAGDLFGDGMNLYLYLRSNPIGGLDPLGLDEIDDLIGDLAGQRVAALGYIHDASGFALIGAKTVVDLAGSILGFDLLTAGKNILVGEATFWDFLEVGMALTGPLSGVARGAAKGFRWAQHQFRNGRKTARTVRLTSMILQKLCFAAGTLIVMGDGSLTPIEQIHPGDMVSCDYDPAADNGVERAPVMRVFRQSAPLILQLGIDVNGVVETITTTPDHPFFVPQKEGYVAAKRLRPGMALRDPRGINGRVRSLRIHIQSTEVYNVEVAGAHNYFVALPDDSGRFLVHNKCVKHHIVPQAILKLLPPHITKPGSLIRGGKGHPNKWPIPEAIHRRIHGGGPRGGEWNRRWLHELGGEKGAQKATEAEVLAIREKLIRDFGLEAFQP